MSPVSVGDCYAVLDPSLTQDGHHGPAFEAWCRDMCGEWWQDDPSKHRYARKIGILPPADLRVPPGGLHIQSIENLRVEDQSQLIGAGKMDAVLSLDGCAFGYWRGAQVWAQRGSAERLDVPVDVVKIHKSIVSHDSPQQSHLDFEGKIYGEWAEAGFRGGTRGWNQAQEDHYTGKITVLGGFDPASDDAPTDLWQWGILAGNTNWSNNLRHHYRDSFVSRCVNAVGAFRSGAFFTNLSVDGCRYFYWFGGAMTKVVIDKGSAENCSRLVIDLMHTNYDSSLTIRDFSFKFDHWRPTLPSPVGWDDPLMSNTLGAWASAGGMRLDNVTFHGLPIRQKNASSPFLYAKGIHQDAEGKDVYELTNIPAPRLHVIRDGGWISTNLCGAHGYRNVRDFVLVRRGKAHHKLWVPVDLHGNPQLGPNLVAVNQYPPVA